MWSTSRLGIPCIVQKLEIREVTKHNEITRLPEARSRDYNFSVIIAVLEVSIVCRTRPRLEKVVDHSHYATPHLHLHSGYFQAAGGWGFSSDFQAVGSWG